MVLAGREERSRSGSASVTTIHAPFTTDRVQNRAAPSGSELQCDDPHNAVRRLKDRLLNLGRSCKSVSRSSHAKGLRRRTCAYHRRNCHANPIRWLADGFDGSNPTCPARQSGLRGAKCMGHAAAVPPRSPYLCSVPAPEKSLALGIEANLQLVVRWRDTRQQSSTAAVQPNAGRSN